MNTTKALSIVLLLVASTTLAFGTFGFTGVSAERGVSVSVVADEHALIGYDESAEQTVTDGEALDLVQVENRLTGDIEVTDVSIDDGPFSIANVTTPGSLSPGESGTISGIIHCTPGMTGTVEVTVALSGSGVNARISGDRQTREISLTCPQADELSGGLHGATFSGAGNFKVNATNVDTTEIVYWTAEEKWEKKPPFKNYTFDTFDTSEKLQPQVNGNTHIVAVYFPEYDVTFVHPNYYNGNWGAGDGIRVSGKHHPSDGYP